jgi:hypothetical protein
MKTLSGTSKFVVLAIIGVMAIVTFRAFATEPPWAPEPDKTKATYVLKIKNVSAVKDEDAFKQMYCSLEGLDPQFNKIWMKHSTNSPHHGEEEVLPAGCGKGAAASPGAKMDIKTDKVIVFEAARNAQLAPIQVHVTQQVASKSLSDIQKVLSALQ